MQWSVFFCPLPLDVVGGMYVAQMRFAMSSTSSSVFGGRQFSLLNCKSVRVISASDSPLRFKPPATVHSLGLRLPSVITPGLRRSVNHLGVTLLLATGRPFRLNGATAVLPRSRCPPARQCRGQVYFESFVPSGVRGNRSKYVCLHHQ